MAKQLSIVAEDRIDYLDEAAEALREAQEALATARDRHHKAESILISRMIEAKRSRYECANNTGTGLLVLLNVPDPTVRIKVLEKEDA